jgi:PAS domain S-box-containing protein
LENDPSTNPHGTIRDARPGENLQLLKTTIDSSLDLIQVFEAVRNEEGRIIDFVWLLNNEASARIYGDVIGKSLLALQPGVVDEGIFDAFRNVVETGVPQQYEKHYVHEQFDGWFQQSVVKLNDGVATTTTNITSRKQAEQELRESKTLLKDVIDAPRIGIAVYQAVRSTDGEIIDFIHEYINRASIEMLGGEDFTGRLFTAHGANALEQMSQFKRVMETGERNSYVREADLLDRKFWFAITNSRLDSERLVHTWEDVSEQKNAEIEILRLRDEVTRRAEDKYRLLFNSMDEGFYVCEVIFDETNQPVDILYLEENPAALRMIGQSFVGKTLKQIHPSYESYWFQIFGEVAITGEGCRKEQYSATDSKWFDFYITRIGDSKSHRVAVVFNDITDRKKAEEALQLAHEAYRVQLEREVRDRTLELIASRDELEREQYFLEQVTDKAPLLIYVYDLGEERFTYINKRVEELIGKSEEYIYAMGPHLFQAILHPDDLAGYTAYMKGLQNLSGGQVAENEFRVWNGAQFRWFRSRDSVFREVRMQVLQVIGIAEDVTYEKMLEEKLQSNGPVGLN